MSVQVSELNSIIARTSVYSKVSEQRLDEEQQAAGEVRNSRQTSGQQQTQCAYWW